MLETTREREGEKEKGEVSKLKEGKIFQARFKRERERIRQKRRKKQDGRTFISAAPEKQTNEQKNLQTTEYEKMNLSKKLSVVSVYDGKEKSFRKKKHRGI